MRRFTGRSSADGIGSRYRLGWASHDARLAEKHTGASCEPCAGWCGGIPLSAGGGKMAEQGSLFDKVEGPVRLHTSCETVLPTSGIREVDGLIITAGAGMGVDSSLPRIRSAWLYGSICIHQIHARHPRRKEVGSQSQEGWLRLRGCREGNPRLSDSYARPTAASNNSGRNFAISATNRRRRSAGASFSMSACPEDSMDLATSRSVLSRILSYRP